MFKVFDLNIHLHDIPGIVWAFLIAALVFLGVIYLVPEAKQALGSVFDHKPAARVQPLRSPKAAEFGTKEDAVTVCGKNNVSGPWIEPQSMHESYYCEQ